MTPEKAPAYQWYPKDCLSDPVVVAMTLEAEGAYRRLLDFCWLDGSIPTDMGVLAGMCKLQGARQMERLWPQMRAKFDLVTLDGKGERFINSRVEKERQKQADNRVRRQKAADERWARERALHEQSTCNADAKQCLASSSSTASSTAVSTEKTGASRPSPSAFVEAWNAETAHPIARCSELTPKRRKAISARLRERPISDWIDIFRRINTSRFCRGENDRGWVASVDWVLQPDTGAKVLEGKYDDRPGPETFSAADLAKADEVLRKSLGGRCPHEPTCETREDCRREIVRGWRQAA